MLRYPFIHWTLNGLQVHSTATLEIIIYKDWFHVINWVCYLIIIAITIIIAIQYIVITIFYMFVIAVCDIMTLIEL